jgi:hypothetical protein
MPHARETNSARRHSGYVININDQCCPHHDQVNNHSDFNRLGLRTTHQPSEIIAGAHNPALAMSCN